MSIEVFPLGLYFFFYTITSLGAGQDVGRSCIIIKILDKTLMLDCGLHMGYSDNRKYPDFKRISNSGSFDLMFIYHLIKRIIVLSLTVF